MTDSAAEHLPLTPATFQLLLSLSAGPRHGWALRQEIDERTQGRVRLGAGTLYSALQRMEGDALIRETEAPEDLEGVSPRWRFFVATDFGRDVLRAEVARLEENARSARALLADG